MKVTVRFPESTQEVDARWILEHSTISWPELQWIYCEYPEGGKFMHIEVNDFRMRVIRFLGAPGPNWEAVDSLPVPLFRVDVEADKISCRLDDDLYVFPAKK